MKKILISTMALFIFLSVGTSLARETVSVVGSSSVAPLMEVLSENYMKSNPRVFIEVQGPGSSAGIKAVQNGSADIGMVSRNLRGSEKQLNLVERLVAQDGIAVIVNPQNTIKGLNSEQISAIYRGQVRNWKYVGGNDQPIVAITRDTASGTRGAFEEIMKLKRKIGGKEVSAISQRAQVANGNGSLKVMVASNPYAIGYISLGSVDPSIQSLSVNGFSASVANVSKHLYDVRRPFLILYKKSPKSEEVTKFIKWILSGEAQDRVRERGYISIN